LSDPFLELFSFPTSILMKLLKIFYALPWSTKLRFLPLLSLLHHREQTNIENNERQKTYIPQKLFSSDLNGNKKG